MLDADIYSQFRPQPAPSPYQGIAQLMKLRGQTYEIMHMQALAEQERQAAEVNRQNAEQKRRDLADESTIQELAKDPVLGPQIATGDVTGVSGKVQQKYIDLIQKNGAANVEAHAKASGEELKNRGTAFTALREGMQALGDDPATINEHVNAFKSNPANAVLFKNAGIDPNNIPTIQDPKQLKDWEIALGQAQAINDAALKFKEQGFKTDKAGSEAESAAIKVPVERAIANATLSDKDYLSPEQREKATEAENKPATTLGAEEQFVQEYQRLHGGTIAQAQRAYALNKDLPSKADPTAALDRESTRFAKPHEKSLADANAQLEKIADARAMVNGSAEAQALGIPKTLTALVSGQGSGIRITQAELNSIASARGVAGTFEGWASKLAGQGKLNDTQKAQLTQILDDVAARVRQKQALANDALDRINGAHSRDEIVKIDSDVRKKLTDMEHVQAVPGGIPTPASQSEYNALPKGAQFHKPNDSKVYIKQ